MGGGLVRVRLDEGLFRKEDVGVEEDDGGEQSEIEADGRKVLEQIVGEKRYAAGVSLIPEGVSLPAVAGISELEGGSGDADPFQEKEMAADERGYRQGDHPHVEGIEATQR